MHRTPVRRAAVAASVVSLSLVLAACGGSEDEKKDAKGDAKGSSSAATAPAAKALTQAELEKLALTKDDLKDHEFNTPKAADLAKTKDASSDKAECKPLSSALIAGAPAPATAAVMRQIMPMPAGGSSTGTTEEQKAEAALKALSTLSFTATTLNSYEGKGAEDAMAALKKAATDCAAGFTVSAAGETTKVTKVAPATYSGGDEALAYTLTMDMDGKPSETHLVTVRKGATVANFYTLSIGGKTEQPKAIADAQLKKLG
ncbi:hypothetical protein ACH4E8_17150 [Streptomyces sp. NPDC017979]|uniref:hypothetical protein n=1 Tax=Streptomyces sp. NPDC017979 TaxID=3365024 RepID=UPI0037996704